MEELYAQMDIIKDKMRREVEHRERIITNLQALVASLELELEEFRKRESVGA